ncbi:MAG: cytochrome C biosynthesis protein [Cyclobacteriaceae bacterium]
MAKTKKAAQGSELLESPEALAEQLSKTEEFLEKNRNMVFLIGGLIAVAIVGFFGYRYYLSNQNELAQRDLFQAQFYFEADSLGKALNGDGLNYGFLDVISEYPGTKAANLSNYYAGVTYMQLGDYEAALRYLEDFDGDGFLLEAQATSLIGDAYMELEQYETAAGYYKQAANTNQDDNFSPIFLQKAAVAYEKINRLNDAHEAYSTIVNDFSTSTMFQDAKKHVARLEKLTKG